MRGGFLCGAVAALLLTSCGGNDARDVHSDRQPEGKAERSGEIQGETAEREKALSSIPSRDSLAFIQISVATGELRVGASVLSVRRSFRRRDTLALLRLRPRIEALRPVDRRLRRLRAQLLVAVNRTIEARADPSLASRLAPRTLAAADRILSGLRRYVNGHPGVGVLVPD
jgi:hypothetical protein